MNFTKYKTKPATAKKSKKKGSKNLTKTKQKPLVKKTTRYTRQFSVNLTKSMAAVRSLLKINKNAKGGLKLSKTSG